ncbi:helix-turn-helix transcriptional regulator [Nonomuraea sp. NPDC023979]|uniref:helix-turn-helix domain-containing protein n=1 Tax=Nonomuraea sp. NPDC023979 TaxID=3154796 RepID=UPI0033D67011
MTVMVGEDRQRLADYVIRRRVAMGYKTREDFAAAVRLSVRTLGDIERARRPVAASTVAAVEEFLRWQPGSFTAILAGGEPELVDEESEPSSAATPPASAPERPAAPEELIEGNPDLRAIWNGLADIAQLTPDERIHMFTLVRVLRQASLSGGSASAPTDPLRRRPAV